MEATRESGTRRKNQGITKKESIQNKNKNKKNKKKNKNKKKQKKQQPKDQSQATSSRNKRDTKISSEQSIEQTIELTSKRASSVIRFSKEDLNQYVKGYRTNLTSTQLVMDQNKNLTGGLKWKFQWIQHAVVDSRIRFQAIMVVSWSKRGCPKRYPI